MDNYQEEIERYIEDRMSSEEKISFQKRLSEETELAESLRAELEARSLVTDAGRLEVLETLEGYESEMNNSKSGVVIPLWTKRLLPIAAMLVIFFGVYNFFIGNKLTTTQVYETYFETYDGPSNLRSVEGNDLVEWDTASKLYSEKKYGEALGHFTKAEGQVPQYLVHYYRAMCDLNIDAPYYQRAINKLDLVLETDNDFHEQALWYKALALLNTQRKQEAFDVLELLVERNGYKATEAKKILETKLKD